MEEGQRHAGGRAESSNGSNAEVTTKPVLLALSKLRVQEKSEAMNGKVGAEKIKNATNGGTWRLSTIGENCLVFRANAAR